MIELGKSELEGFVHGIVGSVPLDSMVIDGDVPFAT